MKRIQLSLRDYIAIVAAGYFVMSLGNIKGGICYLPLQYLLKNRLHLSRSGMASFFALAGMAWYFKPFAGIVTDTIRIFGTRRRHYILICSALASILWLISAAVQHVYIYLLWSVICLDICLVLAQTALGGLFVEGANQHTATGRLSSQRVGAEALAALLSAPLGGYLAHRAFGWSCAMSSALMLAVALLFYTLAREGPMTKHACNWPQLRRDLSCLWNAKDVLIASLFIFMVRFSPGFQTPLFYFQTNNLHFSPEFVGTTRALAGIFGIGAVAIYAGLCHLYKLSSLLKWSIVIHALGTLPYLLYNSRTAALWVEASAGLVNVLAFMPILDMLTRATPAGIEATCYALIFSVGNISWALSDLLGSWMLDHLHLRFAHLVWLNAGTTAMVLLFVPLIPKPLMDRRETDPIEGDRTKQLVAL